jgi:hypothetical protein
MNRSYAFAPPAATLRQRAGRVLAPVALLLALATSAYAQDGSFRHEVLMRGQVLEADAGALVVCVGEADGAQVGQVLEVVRHKRVSRSPKAAGPRFRREPVGQVRITELFDTHYAQAQVVTGKPKVNDTVELIR